MSGTQETVFVVNKFKHLPTEAGKKTELKFVGAAKVFDDRKDARAYCKSMKARSMYYTYKVFSCKKG